MSARRMALLVAAVAAIAALFAYQAAYRLAVSAIDRELDQSLILTRRAIETEVERFRALPDVAGEDIRVGRALSEPHAADAITEANRYLATINRRAGATELYLLDARGTAIAASNWATDESFVGINYAFRPYFADAMADGRGRFYAIGVTTGKPGYFLSTRVGPEENPGVMVVKVDLRPLEATWKSAGVRTAIADPDGIIFLSGVEDWLYRPLSRLSTRTLDRVATLRTYDGVDLAGVAPLLTAATTGEVLDLPGVGGEALRGRSTTIAADGWQLISAAPIASARASALVWSLAAALVATAATGLGVAFRQRRQLVQLRLRQGALLEARVAERTRELAQEIEARRKTEADLRAAQETLVHTEKMAALGRMSAAIVHELSQPLAAMEATLAAADLSGDGTKTKTRIGTARNLIARMQRTTKHLKSFSRKEQNLRTLTDLDKVAENALELVAPRAKAVGITPLFQRSAEAPLAMAGPVRLEQVCLNLLLNALDAVEGQPAARITVETARAGASVSLTVSDNGPGIAPDMLARVTEPFFSTKIGGEGLGLGLSISQAIVTEFGGRIDISSTPGTGTRVTVILPAAPAMREAAE
ncbi:ATP-binding protein [Frigidibacter sp. RF13]|uniref:sensor histidine kinase n=1 Tax=Frigidibacter sp. RF13 TaxID=2997340 RepID=UPI002270F932|nr:ATP-binding protein [Frigidibacter sp. RF13]MCY1128006.1 ATP-binding protein [Frigidibacter sp. RF13]